MKFNGIQIREESIHACRQWFIDNQQACIASALDGSLGLASHVDPLLYVTKCTEKQIEIARGKWDNTITFMQRAYYIQTGEFVALLP